MHTAGQKMISKRELFSSLLFPKRCPVCDEILEPEEINHGIHSACESKLYPIQGAVCMHCGRPFGDNHPEYTIKEYCYDCVHKGYDKSSYVTQAKSLFRYKGAVKETMYRFKYSNKREYAYVFAKQAMKAYAGWLKRIGAEAIVPVPLYRKKQKKRGYNQAESFAKELSKQMGIPIDTHLIYRIKDTAPQKTLNDIQRKNNLKNAFHSGRNVVQYKCVVVVDDIYTTGNTAEAVAKELIKNGAHRVYLLTVCIGGDI